MLAIFRALTTAAFDIRRVEMPALYLATDMSHDTGANLNVAGKCARNFLQEDNAQVWSERPGREHHGIEFVVGQANGRHAYV